MRAILLVLSSLFTASAWSAEDIVAVLQRSQQMQLAALTEGQVETDDPRVQVVQASFERVLTLVQAPDDVKLLASSVLEHRLIVSPEAALRGISGLDVIRAIAARVPVPGAAG